MAGNADQDKRLQQAVEAAKKDLLAKGITPSIYTQFTARFDSEETTLERQPGAQGKGSMVELSTGLIAKLNDQELKTLVATQGLLPDTLATNPGKYPLPDARAAGREALNAELAGKAEAIRGVYLKQLQAERAAADIYGQAAVTGAVRKLESLTYSLEGATTSEAEQIRRQNPFPSEKVFMAELAVPAAAQAPVAQAAPADPYKPAAGVTDAELTRSVQAIGAALNQQVVNAGGRPIDAPNVTIQASDDAFLETSGRNINVSTRVVQGMDKAEVEALAARELARELLKANPEFARQVQIPETPELKAELATRQLTPAERQRYDANLKADVFLASILGAESRRELAEGIEHMSQIGESAQTQAALQQLGKGAAAGILRKALQDASAHNDAPGVQVEIAEIRAVPPRGAKPGQAR